MYSIKELTFDSNQIVLNYKQPIDSILIVASGVLSIVVDIYDYKEIEIANLPAGSILNFRNVLLRDENSFAQLKMKQNGTILQLPISKIEHAAQSDNQL